MKDTMYLLLFPFIVISTFCMLEANYLFFNEIVMIYIQEGLEQTN